MSRTIRITSPSKSSTWTRQTLNQPRDAKGTLAIILAGASLQIVVRFIGRQRQPQHRRLVTRRMQHAGVTLMPCPVRASTTGNLLSGEYPCLLIRRTRVWSPAALLLNPESVSSQPQVLRLSQCWLGRFRRHQH